MNCRRKTGDYVALASSVLPVSLTKKRLVPSVRARSFGRYLHSTPGHPRLSQGMPVWHISLA
jgi:hypothetical protein